MSARDYALAELDRRLLPGWSSGLMRSPVPCPIDSRDRRLAEQIIVGVIKNQLHLRWLIGQYAHRSLESIDRLTQKIMAIALYQMRFLDRVPESAAVNEAVEQARRLGRPKAVPFVNAVLRNALREPEPPLPDPTIDPRKYAEVALSHPASLFDRLVKVRGVEQSLAFCRHNNAEPPTIVRLMRGAELTELAAEGVSVSAHVQAGMYIVTPAVPQVLGDWALRGIAQVQDPTAAGVVGELELRPGQSVLDRCCGLGTKTLQIREAIGDAGVVIAMDPAEERALKLDQLLRMRHLTNVTVRQVGMVRDLASAERGPFDRLLADVPCGNSGVLARRPEACYAQDEQSLQSLTELQDRILDDSADSLSRGGRMVYSTCSIWPEENGERVAAFLKRRGDYRLIRERMTWPSLGEVQTAYHDGGYLAVLERA